MADYDGVPPGDVELATRSNSEEQRPKRDRSGSRKSKAPFLILFGYRIGKNPFHPKRCRGDLAPGEVRPNLRQMLRNFCIDNYFLILNVAMILLALPNPRLGTAEGPLMTKYSVSYGVNICVFFCSGVVLKTEALIRASSGFKLNFFIQFWVFVIAPAVFYATYLLLMHWDLQKELAQGFCILGCLPMTINMCYILTNSAKADGSIALFNATLGNIMGTFLSPLLIIALLGVSANVTYSEVLLKLTYKVLIPFIVGQCCLHAPIDCVQAFVRTLQPKAQKLQETLLAISIWASFCDTFDSDIEIPPKDVLIVFATVLVIQTVLYTLSWTFYRLPIWEFSVKQRIAAFYTSSAKTMAMGLPLITAMYEGHPSTGVFVIPLLLYHPTLMVLGSAFLPYFRSLVAEEAGNAEDIQTEAFYGEGALDDALHNPEHNETPADLTDQKSPNASHVVSGLKYQIRKSMQHIGEDFIDMDQVDPKLSNYRPDDLVSQSVSGNDYHIRESMQARDSVKVSASEMNPSLSCFDGSGSIGTIDNSVETSQEDNEANHLNTESVLSHSEGTGPPPARRQRGASVLLADSLAANTRGLTKDSHMLDSVQRLGGKRIGKL